MKTKVISLICALFLICCSNLISNETNATSDAKASGTLTIYCTPELTSLASAWAVQYNTTNPKHKINLITMEANDLAGVLGSENSICFMSNESAPADKKGNSFRIVIGREIIVPVLSSKNPYLKEINEKGISRESMVKSLESRGALKWGTLLGTAAANPVKYFILDNASAKTGVAEFLKNGSSSVAGMESVSPENFLNAIQNDPYAIGFCRLTDVVRPGQEKLAGNIQFMPIDKNGNGRMDYMENIYSDFQDFSRGVWIGKYPKSLTNNIYCVAKTCPAGQSGGDFLKWVLSTGQDLMPVNGFSDLVSSERQSQLDKLNNTPIYPQIPRETNSLAKLILLVLVIFIVVSFTADFLFRRSKGRKTAEISHPAFEPSVFDEQNLLAPKGMYFDKSHTWAFMEQDGNIKVGIDDFLQHITGPITSIGMKKPGDIINKGDRLCIIIQKGKQLNIYAPVSGTVMACNETLLKNSGMINESPFSDGWVYKIEPSNWHREVEFLSMADKYRTWLGAEFNRLKDFLASSLQANSPGYSQIILQDGGVLKDHVLADLGPEVWEDFQVKFINTAR